MYVCVCNGVTDRQIRAAVDEGASSLDDLRDRLKVATCCGRCADCAQGVLEDTLKEDPTLTIPPPGLCPAMA